MGGDACCKKTNMVLVNSIHIWIVFTMAPDVCLKTIQKGKVAPESWGVYFCAPTLLPIGGALSVDVVFVFSISRKLLPMVPVIRRLAILKTIL